MRDALPPAARPRGRACRLAAAAARTGRRRVRFPYGSRRHDRRRLDETGGAPDRLADAAPSQRRVSRDARRRPLPRRARLGTGGPARATGGSRAGARARRERGRARGGVSRSRPVRSRRHCRASTTRAAPRATHWNGFWSSGGAIDLSASTRPALARAGAADRPLAVPDRDPVRGALAAAGDRPDLQQLVRASSTSRCTGGTRRTSRCGTACRCSSAASATTRAILPRRARTARRQGYAGRALAQDDRPRRARSRRRTWGRSSSGSSRTRSTTRSCVYRERRATAPRSRGTADVVFETAEFMASFAAWDEDASATCSGRRCSARRRSSPRTRRSTRRSSWPTGAGGSRRPSTGGSGWDCRASRAGTRCSTALAPLPVRDGRYLFAETAPDELRRPALGARSPFGAPARSGCCPGAGHRPRDDAPHPRLDLGELELAGHLGLGLPDASRCARPGSASPAAPSTRCCWTRRRTPTARTATTTSGPASRSTCRATAACWHAAAMMAAGWDGAPDGRRARLPARRQLDGALGGPAPHALSRAHEVLESCAWCARNWGEPSTTTCGASVHGGSSRSVAAASGKEA